MTISSVADFATQMRRHIISMLAEAGSGHPGGSLSATDILAQLYGETMNIDPTRPDWPERDRLVLCKGHAAPALYAALALRGYFPVEELPNLRKLGSRLQGHPDMRKLAGVDMSTGSLGQGLSAACGMALAGRLDQRDYYVYAILGDGEMQEGQVWEAGMLAAHYRLDHLIAFLDHNKLQIDGNIKEVMSPEPLDEKWRAFGWRVISVDGHHHGAIKSSILAAKAETGRPTMIIAETVKGKGVSFMENQAGWHGNAPSKEQAEQALAELN